MIVYMTGMLHREAILHQGTLTGMKGVLLQMIGTPPRIRGLGHLLVLPLAAMITIDHSEITFLGHLHRPHANRTTLVLPSSLATEVAAR
jgi:hypothetical protein